MAVMCPFQQVCEVIGQGKLAAITREDRFEVGGGALIGWAVRSLGAER